VYSRQFALGLFAEFRGRGEGGAPPL